MGTKEQPTSIFVLVIDEYVTFVNPLKYDIDDFEGVNPIDYFITSGDAVSKTGRLEKDMWTAAGIATKRFGKSKNKKHKAFMADLWLAAGGCRKLMNKLKQIRGDALWLETEWRDHQLICVPKNPRPKKSSDLDD